MVINEGAGVQLKEHKANKIFSTCNGHLLKKKARVFIVCLL